MKKLRLSLDDISVDSFATLSTRVRTGTVAAHDNSNTTCFQIICDCSGHTCDPTCGNSCNGTCHASCNGTCNGCPNPSDNGTCVGWTCEGTCGYTCEGESCDYCTVPPQIVC